MSLPILKVSTTLSPVALARQFVQSELLLSQTLCEPLPVDLQAFCCPELPALPQAHRVLDAHLVDAAAVESAVALVQNAFANVGSSVREWSINPNAPEEVRLKLQDVILAAGYRRHAVSLLLLNRPPTAPLMTDTLQVVPARSSYALTQRLFEESTLPNAAVLARAVPRWLDDPRLDSLLALRAGVAIAFVSVQTMGQVGRVLHLFVAEPHRRQGIGGELLRRAIELCARSLFHHVFATGDGPETQRLLERHGFHPFGTAERYSSFP